MQEGSQCCCEGKTNSGPFFLHAQQCISISCHPMAAAVLGDTEQHLCWQLVWVGGCGCSRRCWHVAAFRVPGVASVLYAAAAAVRLCSVSSEGREGPSCEPGFPCSAHPLLKERVGTRLLCWVALGFQEPLCWALLIPA